MVTHYPPARLRHNSSGQPTAITNVLLTTSGSSSTGEIPLGPPTYSARSRRGRWALYPSGDQVVVVWPGGALTGLPAEVAAELGQLGGDHDALDRGAGWAIRQFLTDPATAVASRWSPARTRTWSRPAVGYWLSGLTNQPGSGDHTPASWPGTPAPVPPIPLPDPGSEPAPQRAA